MRSRLVFPVLLAVALAACSSSVNPDGDGGAGGAAGGSGGSGGSGGEGGTAGGGGDGGSGGGTPVVCGGVNVIDLDGSRNPAVLEGRTDTVDNWEGLCAPDLSYGNDVAVRFRAGPAGYYRFDTAETEVDTVLFALTDCDDGFSQVACSDDVGDSKQAQLTLKLREGEEIYLIVDTVNEKEPMPFTLTASRILEKPPEIEEFKAFANSTVTGSVAVLASGTNPDSPVVAFAVQLYTLTGARIFPEPFVSGFGEEAILSIEQAGGTFEVFGSFSLSGQQLPAIGAVELALVDANGLTSDLRKVQTQAPATVGRGEVCDERRVMAICGDGEGCVKPEGSDTFVCAGAPTVSSVTVTRNMAAGTWGAIVEGFDPEADVVSARVRPKSATGKTLSVGGSAMTPVEFHRLGQDDSGSFRGVIVLEARFDGVCETPARRAYNDCISAGAKTEAQCEADRVAQVHTCAAETLAEVSKVDIDVMDATGLISKIGSGQMGESVEVLAGGSCDPYGAIGICPGDLVCWSEEDAVPEICQSEGPACPETWAPVDLTAQTEGDGWSYDGSLEGLAARGPASCGGGGPTAVFSFTAPEAATYVFETSTLGQGVDAVLAVRRFCQLPAYELACSSGAERRVELALGAGDSIFVLVGGRQDGVAGEFTLSARTVSEVTP